MDNEIAAEIKARIDTMKSAQEELFRVGWQEGGRKKSTLLITLILVLFGGAGVIDVIYRGLSWLSAPLIILGAFALYKGIESDKVTNSCREQYQKNRQKLDELEEQYQELTFIHKSPEQIEREWKEMMREIDDQSRPNH